MGMIAGIAAITAGLILSVLALLNNADHNRRVQVAVGRIEAHANLMDSLEWETIASRKFTPEAQARFRHAEREITSATQALRADENRIPRLTALLHACEDYLAKVTRELSLIGAGQLEAARALDASAVDPSFAQVQLLADQISEQQSQAAARAVFISRMGVIVVALLSTAAIFIYFQHFARQRQLAEIAIAEKELALKSEGRFRTLTEHSGDIIVIADAYGQTSYVSPSVNAILGRKDRAMVGSNLFDWIHPGDVALSKAALESVVAMKRSSTVEFRLRQADGRWLDFSCIIRNLVGDPNIRGLLFNARDVTQDKKMQGILDFNAVHDVLTKLPNRTLFTDRLQKAIDRHQRRPETSAAVLYLDLDDLKELNDSLGHDAGDTLIAEFGQRLRACIRHEDTLARPHALPTRNPEGSTIARLGGDEFVVLLEEVSDPSDAIRVAQRVQASMVEPFVIYGQDVFKAVSIGIAFSSDGKDAASVIANADIAMRRAKVNGKSRSEVYDSEMHAQITRRLDLEHALEQALKLNQFRVHFQPIVSIATGRIVGLEALLRWQKPGVGLVSPADFIGIAEEIGLIVELGQWVLVEACRQAAKWVKIGNQPAPYVSVNVSPRQFAYPVFVDQVRDALRDTGLNPRRLKVELTESTAMGDPERALGLMLQLAELGVTLSLDDFGTGHSSLSALRRFPVKTIKIDRSFISNLHSNRQVAAIVTTICGLARILCMDVIAEGVENLEQLSKLKSISCDYAQGYLLSRPLPPEALSTILGTNLIDGIEGKVALSAGAAN